MSIARKKQFSRLVAVLLFTIVLVAFIPFAMGARAAGGTSAQVAVQYDSGSATFTATLTEKADTLVLHFDQDGGVFKSIAGTQRVYPTDADSATLRIVNSTGATYKIVDIALDYDIVGLPRAYNTACVAAYGAYSKANEDAILALSDEDWYNLNNTYYDFAQNSGSLEVATAYTGGLNKYFGTDTHGCATYGWGRSYVEANIWVSFDETSRAAASYDPALSIAAYNSHTAENRAAIAALGTPFGSEGFSTVFGYKVQNFDNYVTTARHEMEFTITLALVDEEPATTTTPASSSSTPSTPGGGNTDGSTSRTSTSSGSSSSRVASSSRISSSSDAASSSYIQSSSSTSIASSRPASSSDTVTPTGTPPSVDGADEDLPLAGFSGGATWSLLNLLLSLLTLCGAVLLLVHWLANSDRKTGSEANSEINNIPEEKKRKPALALRCTAWVTGLLAPLLFLLLENLKSTMVFANGRTVLFVVLLLLHIAAWALLISRQTSRAER